jgi:hypothetical protein
LSRLIPLLGVLPQPLPAPSVPQTTDCGEADDMGAGPKTPTPMLKSKLKTAIYNFVRFIVILSYLPQML